MLQVRELRMQVPVPPSPMCPKTTRMTTAICLISAEVSGRPSLTMLTSKVSHDVPFGERFCVQEKLEFVPLGAGAGIQLRISGRVVFFKSCSMIGYQIVSFTFKQLQETAGKLVSQLQPLVLEDRQQGEPSDGLRT